MADAIERETGMKPELVAGSGGIFEVRVGSELVYSNQPAGGVPDPQEVLPAVRRKVGTRS